MYLALPLKGPLSRVYIVYACTFKSESDSIIIFSFSPPFLLRRLLCLGGLLGDFLISGNGSLNADTAKDEADSEQLHLRQTVAERDDGEDHGEHLAGDGDGDEQNG